MNKPNHPWKKAVHPNSIANLRPNPENLEGGGKGEIPVEKLLRAFNKSGLSKSELARRMGWERVKPDVHRVNQYLGMEAGSNGEKRKRLTYKVALRLCEAMNADPFECGV